VIVGVDYYPEHWPEDRWERDAELMEEAGIGLVRLAEFAWSKMEPEEGSFNFDWLDRAMEVLYSRGIEVVLGTPTAAPPAWIIEEDRSILPVDENGDREGFGARRHYCPNHPRYREHTRRIVKAMGERFGGDPRLVGWQLDNEFSGRCYCDYCKEAFQDWLKEKYGSLEELNEEWGTIFWSQEYGEWEEIPLPTTRARAHNPGLHLDYYRFSSDSWVDYQDLQLEALRPTLGDERVTHNFMFAGFTGIDYSELGEELDFLSWDNYPLISGEPRTERAAAAHDLARGLGGTGFWVMEEQSGPSGWNVVSATPRPGQIKLWSYQALARGADGIVFFRWRTCRVGTEQYWHGVLDHHGEPGRRYDEVKEFAREMEEVGKEITPDRVPVEVALIKDYETGWAFEIQPNSTELDYEEEGLAHYHGFHRLNVPLDVITPGEDFSDYGALIAPNLYLVNEELRKRLERFVRGGGTLILSYRSGVKESRNNKVVNQLLPGELRQLVGAHVEEYTTLGGSPWGEGKAGEGPAIEFLPHPLGSMSGRARVWADRLKLDRARPLALYRSGPWEGEPAASINEYGAGTVIYLGSGLPRNMHRGLAYWLKERMELSGAAETPAGVEAVWRGEGDEAVLYLLNHNAEEVTLSLQEDLKELKSGERREEITLSPYGVALFRR